LIQFTDLHSVLLVLSFGIHLLSGELQYSSDQHAVVFLVHFFVTEFRVSSDLQSLTLSVVFGEHIPSTIGGFILQKFHGLQSLSVLHQFVDDDCVGVILLFDDTGAVSVILVHFNGAVISVCAIEKLKSQLISNIDIINIFTIFFIS
jgi:hypothetical protein